MSIRYTVILESRLALEDADRQLRRLLKYALRACGLRCTHAAILRKEGD